MGDENAVSGHNVHMTRQLLIAGKRYNLCSVVVQRGNAHDGHYWSICRHTVNQEDTWWVYNDAAELKVATESDIDAPSDTGGAAHSYIAFYVQANERIDSGSSSSASVRNWGWIVLSWLASSLSLIHI